jgi:hypothetical protein
VISETFARSWRARSTTSRPFCDSTPRACSFLPRGRPRPGARGIDALSHVCGRVLAVPRSV